MRKSSAPPSPRTKTTGKTYTYTYDNVGNITSKSDGTSTIAYTYGTDSDAGWSKLLTSYNGESIDYDAIGNPIIYRGANLTWTGRQLNSYTKGDTNITYTYDADGLRGSKTVNGTKTTYQYLDGKLYYQETNGNDTYFYYDSYGNITSFAYYPENGTSGYVLVGTNSLGDVNALYNANGDLMVKYEYDAWGKVIAETDANGNALTGSAKTWSERNPFRYRGYVYDAETGLYYNNSRYYDAEVGRFISADDECVIITSPNSYIEKNLFAYCDNNPVVRADYGGQFWNVIVGAVVGGAVSAVTTALASDVKNTDEIILSFVMGAFSGGFAATGLGGIVGQMVVGGATSLVDSGLQNYNDYKSGEKTLRKAAVAVITDTAMGVAFGASGFDGTDGFEASSKLFKDGVNAFKNVMKTTVHPKVKQAANLVKKETFKHIKNEIKDSFIGNVLDSVVGYIAGELSSLFFGG